MKRLGIVALAAVVGLGLGGSILLGLALLAPNQAYNLGSALYPLVAVGGGGLLMAAAFKTTGTERYAWLLTGLGVALWGLGETIWVWYSFVAKTEVPYPGWADIFYLAGYPIMFLGVLLMPHLRLMRYERARLTLDAIAGSVALAAVMWTLYLGDIVYLDPEAGIAERFVNVLYPLADVILLIALLILAIRRTERRFDPRLLLLSVGLIVTAVADVIYVIQIENGTYIDGGQLDALWLIGYSLFAAAAYLVARPPTTIEQPQPSSRVWQVLAPYAAVGLLFLLTVFEIGGNGTLLQWSSAIVATLVIGRQSIAIKENREIVTRQRDDLVASLSHELRTPLTSVRGFAQLLSTRWDDMDEERRRKMVMAIDAQSEHLARLVADLVDVARNEVSGVALNRHFVSAEAVAKDAVSEVLGPDRDDVSLTIEVPSDLEVLVDESRLRQILSNLLTNAVRYGDGTVVLRATANATYIVFEVHDDGPGVAKKYEMAIWERFERGAHRLDSAVPGSGIGLPIARSLAMAHQGTLIYRPSDLLGGACFELAIPGEVDAVPHHDTAARVEAPVG